MNAVQLKKLFAGTALAVLALVPAGLPAQPYAFGGYGAHSSQVYYREGKVRSHKVRSAPFAPVPHSSVAPHYALRSSMDHYYYTSWGGPCCGPVGEMQLYSGY